MVKVLIIVLTSNKLKLLDRCIKSIDDQFPVKFTFDKIIDVNTVNDNYYNQVVESYQDNKEWKIIRTESNSLPGKGHNSQYNIFKEYKEYEYMIPIDGDDLFYPCAFQILEKSLIKKPDILHLMLNDYVGFNNKKKIKNIKLTGNFKLYSSLNIEKNWWEIMPIKNPFKVPIQNCKTPSRIILVSRNIFNTTIPIKYSENMKLYDDYICFLGIYEASIRNEINIYSISNSYIYHYNATNDDSVSIKFNDPENENKIFKKESIKFKKVCQTNWDLGKLKFLSLGLPDNYGINNKINFSLKIINDINNEKWDNINKLLQNKNYKKLIKPLNFLIKTGMNDTYFVNLNLGISYYKENKINFALYYLDKASYMKPNYEVFNYLFQIYIKLNQITKAKYYSEILSNFKNNISNFDKIKTHFNQYSTSVKKIGKYSIKYLTNIKSQIKPIIVYYTGYSNPFNGKNYKNKIVWGSEIAAVKLCESFSKLGYDVHIFCNCDEEIKWNGVEYHNSNKFNNFQYNNNIDYLIISRFLHFFLENTINAKKNIFLMHDARGHDHWGNTKFPLFGSPFYYNLLNKIDNIVCVSNWQVDNFTTLFPNFDKKLFTVIPNGINTEMFKNSIELLPKKQINRFIFCSDPTRGLKYLIKYFDKIKKKFPDSILDIYFSHIPNDINDKIKNLNYINFRGKLPNDKLIEELKKSDFWIYPNFSSHETFCIAALESMGSGCIPITRCYSGLIDTIGNTGKLIKKEKTPKEFFEDALKFIIEMNTNLIKKDFVRKQCIQRAKTFNWTKISKLWKDKILKN